MQSAFVRRSLLISSLAFAFLAAGIAFAVCIPAIYTAGVIAPVPPPTANWTDTTGSLWNPAGGFPGWEDGIWLGIKSLLLPAISLAVVQAAILARVTRSAVLEVLREDFVRTARAKGLGKREVLWSHVLRNAMIPVMTVMGLQFANLLAGTIVIENVFYLPGLGRLIFQSIANRDLIVVRNCVMLLAAMVVVVNFVVDLLYAAIDPRVKASDI